MRGEVFLGALILLINVFNVFGEAPPYGQLSVEGTSLMGDNKQVALHGMSLFQSNFEEGSPFYKPDVVKELKCDWNSNVVRAPMAITDEGQPGYITEMKGGKTLQKDRVETVIKAAIQQGIYVIVDWHSHVTQGEAEEIDFFTYIATTYSKNKNMLYEILNEPKDEDWAQYQIYQQKIVNAIRKIDPVNLIIVGTPKFCQNVDTITPLTGENLCYSVHFYAGTHKQELRDKVDAAIKKGLCIFVSEYGTVTADGNGAVDAASTKEWWKFLDERKISYVNWAISNKEEGSAALKKGTQEDQLGNPERWSESGKLVHDHLMGQDNGVSCGGSSSTGSSSATATSTGSTASSTGTSGTSTTASSGSSANGTSATGQNGTTATNPTGTSSTNPTGTASPNPTGTNPAGTNPTGTNSTGTAPNTTGTTTTGSK